MQKTFTLTVTENQLYELNDAANEVITRMLRDGQDEAEIKLRALPETVELTIEDDGVPFNLLEHAEPPALRSLQEATLGGLRGTSESTILGGVVELIHYKSYGVAAIVFIASIVVPISKFVAIIWLARRAGRPATVHDAHRRLHVYEVVEFVGRWSMIDVFVVAILSALVQLGFVASIHPGPAAVSFALSVAFTMLSAQSFDPRLIWRGLPLRSYRK